MLFFGHSHEGCQNSVIDCILSGISFFKENDLAKNLKIEVNVLNLPRVFLFIYFFNSDRI